MWGVATYIPYTYTVVSLKRVAIQITDVEEVIEPIPFDDHDLAFFDAPTTNRDRSLIAIDPSNRTHQALS
jgi:hypothetical protein